MNFKHYFSMQHILALVTFIYAAVYVSAAIVGAVNDVPVINGIRLPELISAIGTSVLGLCALSVLVRKEPDLYFTAGIMGIGFGIHMVFSFVAHLDGKLILEFILGVIGIIAGLLTIMFSVPLYCGNRYDTKRILVVLGVYLAAYILPIALLVAFAERDFYILLKRLSISMFFFVPVVLYIVMLYKTDVGYRGASSRSNSNIKMLTSALYSDQNTYAWRSDVRRISNEQFSNITTGKGHVVSENTLPLMMGGSKAYLVLQKWDNGSIYGMIMRHEEGTIIQTLRFEVVDIVTEGDVSTNDSFTIYGKEGFFIKILIKDEEVERNDSRTRKILTWLVGANSKY